MEQPLSDDEMAAKYLKATRYVTVNSPAIQSVARPFKDITSKKERAIGIHNWVRDKVKFGFARAFWDQTADQVLQTGMGFCNTKSTLLVALMRACDIPARQVFVNIRGDILYGFVDPGLYVDHSYAEVYLDGKWIKTDSYIADPQLFGAAQTKLKQENKPLGYGITATGTIEFDGVHDSFSQFVQDGSVPKLSTRYHGVFEDVGDFYANCTTGIESGGTIPRMVFLLANWFFDSKIEALRKQDK